MSVHVIERGPRSLVTTRRRFLRDALWGSIAALPAVAAAPPKLRRPTRPRPRPQIVPRASEMDAALWQHAPRAYAAGARMRMLHGEIAPGIEAELWRLVRLQGNEFRLLELIQALQPLRGSARIHALAVRLWAHWHEHTHGPIPQGPDPERLHRCLAVVFQAGLSGGDRRLYRPGGRFSTVESSREYGRELGRAVGTYPNPVGELLDRLGPIFEYPEHCQSPNGPNLAAGWLPHERGAALYLGGHSVYLGCEAVTAGMVATGLIQWANPLILERDLPLPQAVERVKQHEGWARSRQMAFKSGWYQGLDEARA